MYAGRIVEYGDARDVLVNPAHPYTIGLLASTVHGQNRDRDIEAVPGSPPDLRRLVPGCSFRPRCKYALARAPTNCRRRSRWPTGSLACCFRAGELADLVGDLRRDPEVRG